MTECQKCVERKAQHMYANKKQNGKVWLVGAGPGDVGLLSQKGFKVLQEAEVIIFDALISLELLALLPQKAELLDVGKRAAHHTLPQQEINQLLLEKAKEGKKVVRLKGGEPFVFGRGGEELELLVKEQIPFEIVPGITSSIAVPAYNGIPVTHRDFTSSFHVITGHKKRGESLDIDFKALVEMQATLVFLMGVSAMDKICSSLIENGMCKDMPAAILERGTTCHQKRVVATVETLKKEAEKVGIKSPAIIVVGQVCSLEKKFAWFEKKPLFGKQILLTRPKNRMATFAKKVRDLGAQVIEFPTIQTIPINELGEPKLEQDFWNAIKKIEESEEKKCIAFTSPQGVEDFFLQLRRQKKDIRSILADPKLSFAVIGSATKRKLEQYGIFADYMPKTFSANALGELLVQKLSKDTKVYLFRAEKGSLLLTKRLQDSELEYEDVAVYRTIDTNGGVVREKIEQAFLDGEIDYVTFTSASTVKGFVKNFTKVDYREIHAVCIGEHTAKEAQKYHMHVTVSEKASVDSMIDTLLTIDGHHENR